MTWLSGTVGGDGMTFHCRHLNVHLGKNVKPTRTEYIQFGPKGNWWWWWWYTLYNNATTTSAWFCNIQDVSACSPPLLTNTSCVWWESEAVWQTRSGGHVSDSKKSFRLGNHSEGWWQEHSYSQMIPVFDFIYFVDPIHGNLIYWGSSVSQKGFTFTCIEKKE